MPPSGNLEAQIAPWALVEELPSLLLLAPVEAILSGVTLGVPGKHFWEFQWQKCLHTQNLEGCFEFEAESGCSGELVRPASDSPTQSPNPQNLDSFLEDLR